MSCSSKWPKATSRMRAGDVAGVAHPVGAPAGPRSSSPCWAVQRAAVDLDVHRAVEDLPELAAVLVALQREAAARLDGDDLDGRGLVEAELLEVRPRAGRGEGGWCVGRVSVWVMVVSSWWCCSDGSCGSRRASVCGGCGSERGSGGGASRSRCGAIRSTTCDHEERAPRRVGRAAGPCGCAASGRSSSRCSRASVSSAVMRGATTDGDGGGRRRRSRGCRTRRSRRWAARAPSPRAAPRGTGRRGRAGRTRRPRRRAGDTGSRSWTRPRTSTPAWAGDRVRRAHDPQPRVRHPCAQVGERRQQLRPALALEVVADEQHGRRAPTAGRRPRAAPSKFTPGADDADPVGRHAVLLDEGARGLLGEREHVGGLLVLAALAVEPAAQRPAAQRVPVRPLLHRLAVGAVDVEHGAWDRRSRRGRGSGRPRRPVVGGPEARRAPGGSGGVTPRLLL